MNPKVYIIILNWNGFSDTAECLKSLQSITYTNFKVLVVDNYSKNNEAKALQDRFGNFIEVIKNSQNYGFAKGNNIGIQRALAENADLILLLNNDTVVKSDFLSILVETSQKDKIGIVGPAIYLYNSYNISSIGGNVKWFSKFIINHVTEPINEVKEFLFLTGCCLLIKKEIFKNIGLLDESFFFYYEDADFCLRTVKAGYKITVNPQSVIWHKISRTVKSESEKYHYYTNRNKLLFTKKNAPFLIFLYHYFRAWLSLAYIGLHLSIEKDPNQIIRLKAVRNGIKDFQKGKFYENSN